jgi:hypothetical protein
MAIGERLPLKKPPPRVVGTHFSRAGVMASPCVRRAAREKVIRKSEARRREFVI